MILIALGSILVDSFFELLWPTVAAPDAQDAE